MSYTYVNRDNAWLDFRTHNLDITAGRMTLARLPSLASPLTDELAHLLPPDASVPAGIAVAPDTTIFFTVRSDHTIARIDGCDGSEAQVACLGGDGATPPRMHEPNGVLVHPERKVLIAADTGNHRLQVFNLSTFQLLDVWGDAGYSSPPAPSNALGRFDTPCALAAGPNGRIYVVDRGNRRVQQFTAGGQVIATFWERLAAQVTFGDPVAIAVATDHDQWTIAILDRAQKAVFVVDPDGELIASHPLDIPGEPLGLAVTSEAVFVGSNGATGGRVFRLRPDGTAVGIADGYAGPVAGLALDANGALLVHPGWSNAPIRLDLGAAYVRRGLAWGGPFGGFAKDKKHWHQLQATMTALPDGAQAQFFVHTTDDATAEPTVDATSLDPFPEATWSAGPPNLATHLIDASDAPFAWLGLLFSTEGASSPSIEQIRLEFDHTTYIEHLPAIYREAEDAEAFLPRYLALVESLFTDVEHEIDGLTRLLDPAAAPAPFLMQLARWLAVDITTDWDEMELRDAVADAYFEAAARGTVSGLRSTLRRATGVDAWIEEPLRQSAWWALAADDASAAAERETSVLGVTTMLAAAEPQGAVLGSTATIDRSHLIENDEYGVPLFESVAHRFVVRLYQGAAIGEDRLRAVEAVLDRERPAHTEYVLCRVDPRLEIGVQSRIGVDAIVGGAPLPAPLDEDAVLGDNVVLGGEPPGRIGEHSEIGVTTLLGRAAVGDSWSA